MSRARHREFWISRRRSPAQMKTAEREQLKEGLRAILSGRGDGIDLDTEFHWVAEGIKEPVPFFDHLPCLLPPDSILYVEGTTIIPQVAGFYANHHTREAVSVIR